MATDKSPPRFPIVRSLQFGSPLRSQPSLSAPASPTKKKAMPFLQKSSSFTSSTRPSSDSSSRIIDPSIAATVPSPTESSESAYHDVYSKGEEEMQSVHSEESDHFSGLAKIKTLDVPSQLASVPSDSAKHSLEDPSEEAVAHVSQIFECPDIAAAPTSMDTAVDQNAPPQSDKGGPTLATSAKPPAPPGSIKSLLSPPPSRRNSVDFTSQAQAQAQAQAQVPRPSTGSNGRQSFDERERIGSQAASEASAEGTGVTPNSLGASFVSFMTQFMEGPSLESPSQTTPATSPPRARFTTKPPPGQGSPHAAASQASAGTPGVLSWAGSLSGRFSDDASGFESPERGDQQQQQLEREREREREEGGGSGNVTPDRVNSFGASCERDPGGAAAGSTGGATPGGGAGSSQSKIFLAMDSLNTRLRGKLRTDQQMARLAAKSEEYRQLFDLPANEVVVDVFNCALQRKMLYQGHLYLFERHVCFYSAIWGEKKQVIPLKGVTAVRKANHAKFFPNAVEVVAADGQKHFFASFLSRDEAFRIITTLWCSESPHARHFLGNSGSASPAPPSEAEGAGSLNASPREEDNVERLPGLLQLDPLSDAGPSSSPAPAAATVAAAEVAADIAALTKGPGGGGAGGGVEVDKRHKKMPPSPPGAAAAAAAAAAADVDYGLRPVLSLGNGVPPLAGGSPFGPSYGSEFGTVNDILESVELLPAAAAAATPPAAVAAAAGEFENGTGVTVTEARARGRGSSPSGAGGGRSKSWGGEAPAGSGGGGGGGGGGGLFTAALQPGAQVLPNGSAALPGGAVSAAAEGRAPGGEAAAVSPSRLGSRRRSSTASTPGPSLATPSGAETDASRDTPSAATASAAVAPDGSVTKEPRTRSRNLTGVAAMGAPGSLEEAPPVPSGMLRICQAEFPVPPGDFFAQLFSDEAADFFRTFHERRGDTDFQCSAWAEAEEAQAQEQPSGGSRAGGGSTAAFTRTLTFRHPINFFFGPKSTGCRQVQRCQTFRDCHLVISTSQQMADLPLGDYFSVNVRWDVERAGLGRCTLAISLEVAFVKRTMLQGKIEKGALDESTEAYLAWIKHAQERVRAAPALQPGGEPPAVPSEEEVSPPQAAAAGTAGQAVPEGGDACTSQVLSLLAGGHIPRKYEDQIRRMLNLHPPEAAPGGGLATPRRATASRGSSGTFDPGHTGGADSGVGLSSDKGDRSAGSGGGLLTRFGLEGAAAACVGRIRRRLGSDWGWGAALALLVAILVVTLQATTLYVTSKSGTTVILPPGSFLEHAASWHRSAASPPQHVNFPPPLPPPPSPLPPPPLAGPPHLSPPQAAPDLHEAPTQQGGAGSGEGGEVDAWWEHRLQHLEESAVFLERRLLSLQKELAQLKTQRPSKELGIPPDAASADGPDKEGEGDSTLS